MLDQILRDAGRAQVKGVLRSQSVIAGIGNAYSDELLHAAKMSPFKPALSVAEAPEELQTLYAAIRQTLGDAVKRSEGLAASELKGVLRQQSIVAGIGNAYSDELLHAAKMSPFKPAVSVAESPEDLETLFRAVKDTLGDAVRRSEGLSASELKGEKKSHLAVHGRTGETCPVCGDTVREVSFADSSLQYCPTCQTGGKPLADRRMSKLLK